MKGLPVLVLAILIASCGTPHSSEGGSKISSTKVMKHNSVTGESDSITVTGSEFIPVLGRNEAGVRPDLEGIWVLESMPGFTGEKATNNIINQNKNAEGNMKTGEVRDSTTVRNADGSIRTTTTIINEKNSRGNNITPPQNSNPNMHTPEKPKLQFFGSNQTVSGFTGCNKLAGRYSLSGKSSLSFQNAAASTKMACIGEYDENAFLTTLHRVNSYKTMGNELQLMEGENVMMTFTRK